MTMKVDKNKLNEEIIWLSAIQDGDGPGVTRLLYTESWRRARQEMIHKLQSLNITTYDDEVGNLFGYVKGTQEPDRIVATGSHIDTVVQGGKLDGQLGIIAGYMAIDMLMKKYGSPKKTLELFVMAEEEGSRFPYAFWGSKSIFGLSKRSELEGTQDASGILFETAMRESGFDFKQDDTQRKENIDAFVEVHIEQGITLENMNKQVGIVNSIVGQRRFTVVLDGESNHAGTTLMRYRKDTVNAFSKIAQKAFAEADRLGDPLVLTFGHISLEPNTVNVVPGKATFSIDMRHTKSEVLDTFETYIRDLIATVAQEMDIKYNIDKWMDAEPVAMDESIIKILHDVCQDLNLDYIEMHSGAGHDSQIIAPFAPTAMIFTPSIKGISHNPKEATFLEDLETAVNVLAETLYRLAY